jgi:predicted kinase
MPKVYILSGAPLSGKSTWAAKQKLPILSCDKLRFEYFGGEYKFDEKVEKEIWEDFYYRVGLFKEDFIIDNTNCKLVYINKIKENLNKDLNWEVEIVKFEASLLNSYCRNIKRYIFTKKWIPFKVIHQMKLNYNKLWKK